MQPVADRGRAEIPALFRIGSSSLRATRGACVCSRSALSDAAELAPFTCPRALRAVLRSASGRAEPGRRALHAPARYGCGPRASLWTRRLELGRLGAVH